MKIQDAKKAYAAQMDTLWTRKRDLSQALKNCQQGGAPNVDRVEISRELSAVDAQYNEAQGVMESIIERETAIHNAEVAKQQGNALSKAAEEMGKMLEIYHRIASGGQVPPEDEQRPRPRPCCKRETARSTTPSLRTRRKKTAKKRPPARSRARRRSPSPAEAGTPVSTSPRSDGYTAPPFLF